MNNPVADAAEVALYEAGLDDAKFVNSSYSQKSFGDGFAVYDVGHIRLYYERNRGQDTVWFAPINEPDEKYPFCDVSLAMGWEDVESVVKVVEPVSVEKALRLFSADRFRLNSLFSGESLTEIKRRLLVAKKKRVKAMFGIEYPDVDK